MKTVASFFISMFLFSAAFAQSVKNVDTQIENVTIFFNGAQISRNGSAAIGTGMSKIVFSNLPYSIDARSIQLKGTGGMTLLSVNHQYNYMNQQKKSEEVKSLLKQKEELLDKYNIENNMFEVYNAEEEMLKKNQEIKGQQSGMAVLELKNAVDYFRSRLTDIRMKKLDQQKKTKKIQLEMSQIDSQIAQINASVQNPTSEIVAMVSSKANVNASFILTYYAPNAGWNPYYDLRVENITTPVQLNFKANVYQQTGENWDNVKLSLSTANPSFEGTKPQLVPWYLDVYYTAQRVSKLKSSMPMSSAAPAAELKDYNKSDLTGSIAEMGYSASETQQQTTSMLYKIADPYDISGDGKNYNVMIKEIEIPATYEYYCAPKLDKDAFLLAHVTDWHEYNLLSGETNLYFEGTYVGKSNLNVENVKDTIDFSLGRDKGIVVERKVEKDLSSKSIFGGKRKIAKSWTIQVKNNKKTPIDIVVEDQFPISKNTEIKVEQIESKGAELNKTTNILSWKLKVDAGQSQKVGFKYQVEYPKDYNVVVE